MTLFNYGTFRDLFDIVVTMGIGTGALLCTICSLTGYGIYKAFSLINIHNYN